MFSLFKLHSVQSETAGAPYRAVVSGPGVTAPPTFRMRIRKAFSSVRRKKRCEGRGYPKSGAQANFSCLPGLPKADLVPKLPEVE